MCRGRKCSAFATQAKRHGGTAAKMIYIFYAIIAGKTGFAPRQQ